LSISLFITAVIIPQALQQYTRTIVNGQEKWTLNKQFISAFDKEEPQQRQIDPQNLFNQKPEFSHTNSFDKRWSLQLPYPTDTWLFATEADNNVFISAGISLSSFESLYSDLIISTDKGENWTVQQTGLDTLLYTVDIEASSIWVGGAEFNYETQIYNSFVKMSTDLGITWTNKLEVDSFAVIYIEFFNENNGVVVSENFVQGPDVLKVFKTTDKGNSWVFNTNIWMGNTQGPHSIHFSNSDYGWICVSDLNSSDTCRIMNTNDGGMNWVEQFADSLESFEMINFSDLNNGWAAGVHSDYSSWTSELRIYSTTNVGNNWSQQFTFQSENSLSVSCNMYSLDSLNCWLAVSIWPYLKIYRTSNGGNDWIEISQLQLIDFQLGDIEFASETEGWITSGLGMIHYTSDGGYSWEPKHKSVTLADLESLDFINSQIGWAAGQSHTSGYFSNDLVKTTNGGDDWSIIYSDSIYNFEDIDFLSEQLGFGIVQGNGNSYINKTQDGGISWNSSHFDSVELKNILFTDTNNGWAVGSKSYELFITHTTNSGDSWHQQSNINISGWGLNNIDFANSTIGFAVGDNGALIKTTDGGNNWSESWGNLDPNLYWINYDLEGVFVPDQLTCWISGYGHVSGERSTIIAHTTDGGANWDTLSFQCGYRGSNDIFFINESDGYNVGFGYDYKTTDGGTTWSQINYPPNAEEMFFLNQALGWAVSYNGRIYKYYDPNVSGSEEEKDLPSPDNYVLMQNYPNPFNPSTTINFSLPSSGYATLKIYNALGEEVELLLDKDFTAGAYEVEWNAVGLPSGVYFYQLQTEGFVETKKMVLMN
jgi:photosystem II stability/assembly factor-like uncharacterized protein